MTMGRWTANDIPDQSGKIAVITGANSGLGFEAARALARKGAHVVLTGRNEQKLEDATKRILEETPQAKLTSMRLDLADLASVRSFAEEYLRQFDQLHILINNAGVMGIPYRQTADGFEMQFGTNHLGHFALTALLLPAIRNTPGARVVNVSSGFAQRGKMHFDDLNMESNYRPWAAYAQSKLANQLFTTELQRRFEAAGIDAISVAAHPGYAATNLQAVAPQMSNSRMRLWMMGLMNRFLAQSAEQGALPILYAATAPDVKGGEYFGPDGLMEMRGYPTRVKMQPEAHDPEATSKLWELSEQMTGITYDLPVTA